MAAREGFVTQETGDITPPEFEDRNARKRRFCYSRNRVNIRNFGQRGFECI